MDVREVELRHAIEQALRELSAATPQNGTQRKHHLLDALRALRFYISRDGAGPRGQREN